MTNATANPEAEKALVAVLLTSPDVARSAIAGLDSDDLTDDRAREIVAAYQAHDDNDEVLLALTAAEELGEGVQSLWGYMAEVKRTPIKAQNAQAYVGLIQDAARSRRAIVTMNDGITRLIDGEHSIDVLADVTRKLKEDVGQSRGKTLAEAITAYHEKVVAYHEDPLPPGAVRGLSSGYNRLDELTGGFETAFYIVAARPSIGKTALMSQVGVHVAQQFKYDQRHRDDDKRVLYFTNEMTAVQLIERLACALSGMDIRKVKRGHLNEDEMASYLGVLGELYELPLEIIYTRHIRDVLARAYQDPEPGFIVVDYLNKMGGGEGENRNQQFGDITSTLFDLSLDLGIPVIMLAQLSRQITHRARDALPVLSDLRDSGELEQIADVVVMLHRHLDSSSEDWNPRSLLVLKEKDRLGGGQGDSEVLYFGPHGEIRDDRYGGRYEIRDTAD